MPGMTFFEAALKVLRQAEGGPLHFREIARRAISAGYVQTAGRTPEASLGAQLYTHIKKAEASGKEPKVRRVGRAQFALSARTKTGPLRQIEESNSGVRSELFRQLMDLHPRAFENLVGALLTSIGFENVTVTKYSGDGGLDIEAELTVGGVTNVKTAVQVKRWQANVAGNTVRELRGGLMTDQRGLVITTSSFTREARKEAAAEGKSPISLVDGEKLVDLLIENEIGVSKKPVSYLALDLGQLTDFEQDDDVSPSGQALALWPLPGGSKSYLQSAIKMLKYVAQTEPTQSQMVDWMPTAFPKAKSTKTILGYIRVLKTLALIAFEGEAITLTEAGTEALTGEPKAVVFSQLRARVAGIADYLTALDQRPMTLDESHDFFKSTLNVDWQTTIQTKYRLLWLANVGAIRERDGAYVLA